jgi:uncharacterized membrane protein YtjA (UPF0391 family)
LTGFIPALLQAGRRAQPAILFRRNRQISGFRGQEPSFPDRIVLSVGARRLQAAAIARATANRGRVMLSWVVTFLVVALIAGILGFGGIAGVSVEIAKAIFFIAVILFLVSAVVGLVRGRSNV